MRNFIYTVICIIHGAIAFSQTGTIRGKISFDGLPVAGVSIQELKKSEKNISDSGGYYEFKQVTAGTHEFIFSCPGYIQQTINAMIFPDSTIIVNVLLEKNVNELNALVVTGTRTSRRRLESPVAVNILDSKTFNITQSNTLSEGLCFQPGLRMETDCQTCNYTQLRMNGLGGSYAQILINSRPVFTSLMSLYGLDQIPANMIDRVEVVRGGGSVLYGSNAIAGTVNIITKEPRRSSFTLSNNFSLINGTAPDNFINANATVVNKEQTAGISFFASHRNRTAYDANGDGFSEIARLTNNSFGFNSFLRFNKWNKLELNGWSIYEERRGGNKIDEQADKADQSEYRLHNILVGGFDYEHKTKNEQLSFSFYGAGQQTRRTHYTGMDHADAWGHTKDYSLQGGVQANYTAKDFLGGKNVLTAGLENQYENTFDEIKLYDYLIDQKTNLLGAFLQSDWDINDHFTLLSGVRVNKHSMVEKLIVTPRISLLYKPANTTQLRFSYARGFKAPQAFETDMHIAFANGGVSLIRIDPSLIEETSNSLNASLDFNKASEALIYGFTIDGFYTRLQNAFVLEELGTDGNGNKILMRKNGGNATISGITIEGRINYSQKVQLETGITFQKAMYDDVISWSASVPGTEKYLRTPDVYGFYTLTVLPQNRFNAALSGVLTGPMLIPHFAGAPGVNEDMIHISQTFLETNIKLSYRFTLKTVAEDLQISCGVQNIFNEYQTDFDLGKKRDSNYIYGPSRPRTYFVGLKFGLM